jgi:hypothetical protein
MDLLSELLFASDHPDGGLFNAGEVEQIGTLDSLDRLHYDVANSSVYMKLGEDSSVHPRVNCVASAAIWRTCEFHRWRPNRVFQPVIEIDAGR